MTFAVPIVQDNGALPRRSQPGDGFIDNVTITTIATDADLTLTVAQMAGGVVVFSSFSAGRSVTTPTAALILAANPNLAVGQTMRIRVSSLAAFAATLVAGVGVTLAGFATVPASSTKDIFITCTAATTVTITCL